MYFPGHFDPDPPVAGPSSHAGALGRPWSPVNYHGDDIPTTRGIYPQDARAHNNRGSEDSVEALDLADYSRTLRRPTADRQSPYPPFPHTSHVHPLSVPMPVRAGGGPQYPEYPPSPDTDRPFSAASRPFSATSRTSRDTFANPPSLVSGATSYESHDSYNRRPYSLPPFLSEHPQNRGPAIFSPSASISGLSRPITSPVIEEDIPDFARGWYDDPLKLSNKSRHTSLPPYLSESRFGQDDQYRPYPSAPSSQGHTMLPWTPLPSERDGPAVDDSIKEERLRMLEREFGRKGTRGNEPISRNVIGSVNEKGELITVGPKKRAGARWAQGILAFGAGFSSLYGALFVKTPTPAPPASKPPAFALYGFSVITFVLVFYLFAIRPCCCGNRRKDDGSDGLMPGGMMVLPVQGPPGGKKKKKNKKGKKGKYTEGGGDVQVNLIVDPSMFDRGQRQDAYGSEDEFGSEVITPQRQQRRGFQEGMRMERDWKGARASLKRMIIVDTVCLVVWAGVFVFILFGKKCPPGAFNGWCDSYNIATAAACLLSVAYGFSVFFAVVDLHMSKPSPRTRT